MRGINKKPLLVILILLLFFPARAFQSSWVNGSYPIQYEDERWIEEIRFPYKDKKLPLCEIFKKLAGDASELCIKLELDADQWYRYVLLQQQIAAMIPVEENRPTIHLKLRGKNRCNHAPDIAMLGGLGPLADAYTLKRLILKQCNSILSDLSLDIFSCPPPRQKTTVSNMMRYYSRLKSFVLSYPNKRNIPFFALSNTAHTHIRFLNYISDNRFINLADYIVEDIAAKHYNCKDCVKSILLLGTELSANANLYTEKFEARKISALLPSTACQKELQSFINRIKSGDKYVVNDLKMFIISEVERQRASNVNGYPPSHILLCCNELSLAFENEINSFSTFMLKKYNIKIIDSENEMLEDIEQHMHASRNIKQKQK